MGSVMGSLKGSVSGWVSAAIIAMIGIAALFPGLLTAGDPTAVNPAAAFTPPSTEAIFGTDTSGRDVFTRIVYGARESLGIALAATGIGMGLAILLGFSSLLGKRIDAVVSRIIEVLFSLPTLVLALLLVAVLGGGVRASIIAVGLATTPGYARILRARARTVVTSGYVATARIEGIARYRIFARHIVPNTLWPLLVIATLGIGQAIIWVSALSFLGLGALPPSPEWGAMLADGRLYIHSAWWLTVMPGLVITLTAAATTILGRTWTKVSPL